ncbi:MAG: hypothetical protein CLLPBCKN_005839 [Chroococcidiopsis cubana SAG 39.79]|nr:hypothetical protein [Chroococcidiopsis cubana SAG 39.79]
MCRYHFENWVECCRLSIYNSFDILPSTAGRGFKPILLVTVQKAARTLKQPFFKEEILTATPKPSLIVVFLSQRGIFYWNNLIATGTRSS